MPRCQRCGGLLRVGVVWFGEMLPPGAMEAVGEAAETCEVMLVVGPSDKPNVEGLLREYAHLQVASVVAKKASGWAAGQVMLKEAQLSGATETSVAEYAGALVGEAVALKALEATDAQYEAAAQRGYFGAKEIAKMFDEGKPLEGWLMEALSRAESKRPSKK